jgi:hypothetical protein
MEDMFGHILDKKCLLKHVIEGRIRMEEKTSNEM